MRFFSNRLRPRLPAFPFRRQWKKAKRQHRVSLVLIGLLLVIVAIPVLYLTLRPEQSEAGWFDGSYGYRRRIPIANSSGSNQTEFQVQLSLDTTTLITANKLQSNCNDLRFTAENGRVLDYWLEPNTCNSATTVVHVKVPSIPTSGANIYWYYGNPSAQSASQADATFIRELPSAAVAWPLDDTTATQSYSRVVNTADPEGRNIVINGTFDSDTTWVKGTGWTIANGVASSDGSSGANVLYQSIPTVTGKMYQVTYTISNYSGGGTLRAFIANGSGTGNGTSRTANGTYTEILVDANTGVKSTGIVSNTGAVFNVDNFTVTELNIPASNATSPTQLLTDGDMETSGTAAWTAGNSATLSKQTGTPYAGSQVLRVAWTSTATPYARPTSTPIVVGQIYRVTGYARSDGTGLPRIAVNGDYRWTGTTSTAWQPFDFTYVATDTVFYLYNFISSSSYVEFDSIVVSPDNYIRPGEMLQDANMEASGTGSWLASGTATLTKQTSSPQGGTQLLRNTQGASASDATQTILATGKTYRVTGYSRSDGSAVPRLRNTTYGNYWTGTTSTSWQAIDITFVASGPDLRFSTLGSSGQYTEWDTFSVTEVSPLVGIPTNGVTLGASTGTNGHGATAYTFDGTNDYVNIYSQTLNSIFNPDEGTLSLWSKVSGAGVWTDGNLRTAFILDVDGSTNRFGFYKPSSNNQFAGLYVVGGINKNISGNFLSGSTSWFLSTLTWSKSKDELKMYINGAQVGSTQTGLGTWAGNFSSARSVIGTNHTAIGFWSGQINDVRLYDRALSAEEIALQYSASSDIQAYTTNNYFGRELFRKFSSGVTVGTIAAEEVTPSAVAEWKFDEGQGQTPQDSTANNNDGVLGGSTSSSTDDPAWIAEDQCVSGKCLRFDGGDYVNIGNPGSLNKAYTGFSVGTWVKIPALPASPQTLVSRTTGSSSNNTFNMSLETDGRVRFWFGTANLAYSATALTPNTWYYVEGVWTGTQSIVYVNGVAGTPVGNTPITTTGSININIGRYAAGAWYFTGQLDEIKIYPYGRSAAQVQADYSAGAAALGVQDQAALSDGLIGYWKMDEISGTTVVDASGNGNTGTLTNAQEAGTADGSGGSTTTLVDSDGSLSGTNDAYNGLILRVTANCGSITANTDRLISDYDGASKTITVYEAFAATLNSCQYLILHQTSGKYGNGMQFDGHNSYITIADNNIYEGLPAMSGSIWIYDDAYIGGHDIFTKGGEPYGADSTWALIRSTNGVQIRISNGTNLATVSCGAACNFQNDAWNHIVFTHDGTAVKLYVNGVYQGQAALTGLTDTNSHPVLLGAHVNGNDGFNGKLDEARVYNRALSPGEVQDLYNFAPGPVGYFKFDDGSGTTPVDSSSNGFNGTLAGGAWNVGKYGKALQFDGSATNYVQLPVNNQLAFHYKNYTVSAWINPNAVSGLKHIVARASSSSPNKEFILYLNGTTFGGQNWAVGGGTASNCSVANAATANTWSHVTYVYNNGYSYCYVNGELRNTSSQYIGTREGGYIREVRIGMRTSSPANNFLGKIDEVRLYDYARTQAQILEDMGGNPSPSMAGEKLPDPVAYYKLDEQQGQTVNNSGTGGSAINGTRGANSGSSTDDPTWKTKTDCKVNGCASFDGGDHANLGNNSALDITSSLTLSAWVKTADTQGYVIAKRNDSASQYGLYINGGTLNFVDSAASAHNSNFAVSDDVWHHLVASVNGTSLSLYVDGKRVSTHTIPALTSQSSVKVLLGARYSTEPTTSFTLAGSIDEVKIYNTALTQDQILLDYNGGLSTSFGTNAPSEASIMSDGAGAPPIAYWNFDEKQDNTCTGGTNDVCDRSENSNDAAWNGTLGNQWTSGKMGSAGNFNGVDNYTRITSTTALQMGTSDWTTEAWIKSSQTTGNYIILDKRNSGPSLRYQMRLINNKLYAQLRSSGSDLGEVTGTRNIADGKWHHVAATFTRSSNLVIYVDGVQDGSASIAALQGVDINSTQPFTIGTSSYQPTTPDTGTMFNGQIDDVKIYNYARTPAQIAYDYNRGEPIAHWKFDECEGNAANDSSGNGNTGTITIGGSGSQNSIGTCATTGAWTNGATGKFNSAFSFDGNDDKIEFSNAALIGTSTNFSLSAWIKTSDSNGTIYCECTADGQRVRNFFSIISGKLTLDQYDPSGGSIESNQSVNTNQWIHVAYTQQGTNRRLYINGILEKSDNSAEVYSGATPTVGRIGFRGHASQTYFDYSGLIDDLRAYNYSLSADQIKQLYNGSFSTFYGPVTGSP